MTQQYRFLPDHPAQKEEAVSFGHKSIVASLHKVINDCPTPFTIGLFGKWGSGKSTVIYSLQGKLDKKFSVVAIDAWKYEEDSFRRQFLISLDEQLKLGLSYKEKLNQSLTETDPTKTDIKFDWNLFLHNHIYVGLIIIVLGFLIRFSQGLVASSEFWKTVIDVVSGLFSTSGAMIFFFQIINTYFTKVEVKITEHRTDSAEGFERKFREDILKRIIEKKKKLVIIIDNLDRCSSEKVVELLSTIKTFLITDSDIDSPCIFVIPCDDKAVKKHVQAIYSKDNSYSSDDADEFLRKFFNAFLIIPPFIDTDLESYTESLLNETGVKDFQSSSLAYVISCAFRENPRQIKQFINSLLSHFILAQERESGAEKLIATVGAVTKNVEFLAKFLIIRQKFANVYKAIEEEHLTIDEIEKRFENENDKDFTNFMRATRSIRTPDVRPFLYLKQSEDELKIPGLNELELALIDNHSKEVSAKLEPLKSDSEKLGDIEKHIISLLRKNKSKMLQCMNIATSSLEALETTGIKLGANYYHTIGVYLDKETISSQIHHFEPSLIFSQIIPNCGTPLNKTLIDKYVDLFVNTQPPASMEAIPEDYSLKLLSEFLSKKDLFARRIPDINRTIENKYSGNIRFMSLLQGRGDKADFVSQSALKKNIDGLAQADINNPQLFKTKMDILLICKDILGQDLITDLLNQLHKLFAQENSQPFRPQKESFVAVLTDLFQQLKTKLSPSDMLNNISNHVVHSYSASSDWNQRKIFIPISQILYNINTRSRSDVDRICNEFISSAEPQNLIHAVNALPEDIKQEVIVRYKDIFRERIHATDEIFNALFPIVTPQVKNEWLIRLINTNQYMRGLNKLKEIKYQIEDTVPLTRELLSKAVNVDMQTKEAVYEPIHEFKCSNNEDFKKTLITQIKGLLQNTNQDSQKIGVSVFTKTNYIEEHQKREILTEECNWLIAQADNSYYPILVNFIVDFWQTIPLENSIKMKFIEFIFDKLIYKSNSMEKMKFGFDTISKLKPAYEEYKASYNNLRGKIKDAATASDTKQVLLGGLKNLGHLGAGDGSDFLKSLEQ